MAGLHRLRAWIASQGHRFRDRAAAGRALASRLTDYADRPNTLILALPRGGVAVGYEIAAALHVPLDLMLVRKLGVPGEEELAMGAIAEGGVQVLNHEVVRELGISPEVIDQVAARETIELERRARLYRDGRPAPNLTGKTVILVDDGLATGATMRAAIAAARAQNPERVIVAAPVAACETVEMLRTLADDVVVVFTPEPLAAIGLWYEDFPQLSDDEVRDLLRRAAM